MYPLDPLPYEMGVSVVLPFFNASRSISITLDSICRSTRQPQEIICVDDGSTDDTSSLIQQFSTERGIDITVSRPLDNQRGAAAARNTGAALASGEWLLFLDADVVLEQNTLADLLQFVHETDSSATVALYRDYSLCPQWLAHFQALMVHYIYQRLNPNDAPCMGTQCLLIRRAVFLKAGGFDESYRSASVEDFALGYNLRSQGYKIAIAANAGIIHNHAYNPRSFVRNYFIKARDLALIFLMRQDVRLKDTGYHDNSNVIVLLQCVTALGLIGNRRFRGVLRFAGLVLSVSLLVTWQDFISMVIRRWGWSKVLQFILLRYMVILIGWSGVATALLRWLIQQRAYQREIG